MLNGIVKIMIVNALVLAMVATAPAADININLYGSSSQHHFWQDIADDFLRSQGCTDVAQAEHTDVYGRKNHGITKGVCMGLNVYIRSSARNSADGIYACKGQVPDANVGIQQSCASQGPRYREMASVSGTSWGMATTGVVTSLECQQVTIGTSDLHGDFFGQTSKGEITGCGTGDYQNRNVQAINTSGMKIHYSVAIPFGFFANKAANTSTSGAHISPAPLKSLTRLQALMIFSGQAFMWSDFGHEFPEKDAIICLRHAGSGAHAFLDAIVMRGDFPMINEDDCPYFQFNEDTDSLMACVNGNGGVSVNTAAAVGYGVADMIAGSGANRYPNVIPLQYNGADPSKTNIQNAIYSFWNYAKLYECFPNDTTLHWWVSSLADYASVDANLPSSKADWWCAIDKMNVTKGNAYVMPGF